MIYTTSRNTEKTSWLTIIMETTRLFIPIYPPIRKSEKVTFATSAGIVFREGPEKKVPPDQYSGNFGPPDQFFWPDQNFRDSSLPSQNCKQLLAVQSSPVQNPAFTETQMIAIITAT